MQLQEYKTQGQDTFGLVVLFMVMTSLDLALMSTCPRELQAMLQAGQEWSVRNCMKFNTQKRRVMAFFETLLQQKARGGQDEGSVASPPPCTSTCPSLGAHVHALPHAHLHAFPYLRPSLSSNTVSMPSTDP